MHIINHFDPIVNTSHSRKILAKNPRYLLKNSTRNSHIPKLDSYRLKIYTVDAINLAEAHDFRAVLRGKMTHEMPFQHSCYTILKR